ncbi:MAG: hypothetical protein CVU09_09530 [Bacteroidetes bacterium HGW-Bacteroidetes-4]|jgi:hypothetical protein|nr:MAG: hypothetical protein CVU09_09530 [Bacteroidetes bacterium HGW-Bacteroidetes-4]
MAERNAKKTPSEGILIQTLDIKQINRSNVDIKRWRDALKAAEGTTENRKLLYELYDDMILDGHLRSVMNKRIMSITNTDLVFMKDGKEVEEMWPVINSKEFKKVLRYIIEAKLYGHSTVEFTAGNEMDFTADLIDRRHVKPRMGLVVKSTGDTTGEAFREPPYNNFVLEVGGKKDFGLLLQASQYVIYKRGALGDYADYLQLFGVPFRHAKYENPESRKVIDEAMANMGSAGWASTPKDVEINILRAEGATGANLIFKGFIKDVCNDEISVTILGQTMTTSDSKNSGFAQGVVHAGVESQIHADDRRDTLAVLNSDVVRILANLGFPTEGGEFIYPDIDTLSLKDRIDIDTKAAGLVELPKRYIYDKYSIPMPEGGEETTGGQQPSESQKPEAQKKAKKLSHHDIIEAELVDEKGFWKKLGELLFS